MLLSRHSNTLLSSHQPCRPARAHHQQRYPCKRARAPVHTPARLVGSNINISGSISSLHFRTPLHTARAAPTQEAEAAPHTPAPSPKPGASTAYPFTAIEQKWQRYWQDNKTFRTPEDVDTSKPKYYVLDMFPYPR